MGNEDIDFKMWNLYVAGKRVLFATRAVVNGRKAVAYVNNGQLQGYEYLDDFNLTCCRHLFSEGLGRSIPETVYFE